MKLLVTFSILLCSLFFSANLMAETGGGTPPIPFPINEPVLGSDFDQVSSEVDEYLREIDKRRAEMVRKQQLAELKRLAEKLKKLLEDVDLVPAPPAGIPVPIPGGGIIIVPVSPAAPFLPGDALNDLVKALMQRIDKLKDDLASARNQLAGARTPEERDEWERKVRQLELELEQAEANLQAFQLNKEKSGRK